MSVKTILKNNKNSKLLSLSVFWFFTDYITNHIVTHIPFWFIRRCYLVLCGAKFGQHTQIDMDVTFMDPNRLKTGYNVHINRQCLIDARGYLSIGNNVSISLRSAIVTGSHDHRSPTFDFVRTKITIEDNVWMGFQSTIVGNVKIGEGAVICAGAVVTKDVEPWSIVAGVPAKKIGERPRDIKYKILGQGYSFPQFI